MNKSVFSFLIISSCLLTACKNDLDEINAFKNEKEKPVSTTTNVEMLYSDSAQLKARIKAPLRESYMTEPSYIEFRKGVQVQFYNENDEISSRLSAGYAISHNEKEIIELRNNVTATNNKSERLNTEHLIWDKNANRIYSDVFTTITSPEKVIYGEGFESEGDFSSYRIKKIKGTVNLKE